MLLTSGEDGPVLQKGQEKSIHLTFRISPEKQANEPKITETPSKGADSSLATGGLAGSAPHKGALAIRSCGLSEGRTPDIR